MKTLISILLPRIALIVGVLAFTVTLASFRSEPVGITFACEGLDLLVDSRTTYNGRLMPKLTWSLKNLTPGIDRFFNFKDIKPGDTGTSTMSLHLKKSDAWVCLDVYNLTDVDRKNNEPEASEDANGKKDGELSRGVEFFAWVDDGDDMFETGEDPLFDPVVQSAHDVLNTDTYTLADSAHGPSWKKNSTNYIGMTWCAGDLVVDTHTADISCDGRTLGNEAQTDSFSFDIAIRALPTKNNPRFLCEPNRVSHVSDNHQQFNNNREEKREYEDITGHDATYTWHQKVNHWWW